MRILRLKAWRELVDTNMQSYLIAILYSLIMTNSFSALEYKKVFLLTTSLASYLCFGVLVNDYYDMPIDLKVGKKTGVQDIPKILSVALILMLLIANTSLTFLANLGTSFHAILAVDLFLTISYSAYPIRFKERGLIGVLVDVMIEKTLPIILIFIAFNYYLLDSCLCLLLFTIMQLKVILDHQIFDYDNDLKMGINTFVTKVGVEKSTNFVDMILRPGYLLVFIVFCIMISLRLPDMVFFTVTIFFGYFLTVLLLRRKIITRFNVRADIGGWIERIPLYDGYITAALGIILLFLSYLAASIDRVYIIILIIAIGSQLYIIRGHYLRIIRGVLNSAFNKYESRYIRKNQ